MASSEERVASVNFVKRAVLQSSDGGNSYNVEVEDTQPSQSATRTEPKVSLYDQLAKTITERRINRVDGKAEELTLEDQEFVNRVMRQKDEEALIHEEEAKEFKRQRLLAATTQAVGVPSVVNTPLVPSPRVEDSQKIKDASAVGDLGVVIVRKKKKKPQVENTDKT